QRALHRATTVATSQITGLVADNGRCPNIYIKDASVVQRIETKNPETLIFFSLQIFTNRTSLQPSFEGSNNVRSP
ncbi:hypothetical protein LINGRAHAP2_LOCUS22586, partial [Linum grandiflorum]